MIMEIIEDTELLTNKRTSEMCEICYEQIVTKSSYDACKHEFCLNCALTWATSKNFCPKCKRNVAFVRWYEGNNERRRYLYQIQEDDEEVCRICEDILYSTERAECQMCFFSGHYYCLMVSNFEIPFYCLDCMRLGVRGQIRRGHFERTARRYREILGMRR